MIKYKQIMPLSEPVWVLACYTAMAREKAVYLYRSNIAALLTSGEFVYLVNHDYAVTYVNDECLVMIYTEEPNYSDAMRKGLEYWKNKNLQK